MKKTFGIFMSIIGVGALIGSLLDFNLLGMLAGSGLLYLGIRWTKKNPSLQQQSYFQFTDEMIIRLAHRKGGILSVGDLVTQSSMSADEAKKRLENLLVKQVAEIKITEIGNIVYDFKSIQISDQEKKTAKGLDEMNNNI